MRTSWCALLTAVALLSACAGSDDEPEAPPSPTPSTSSPSPSLTGSASSTPSASPSAGPVALPVITPAPTPVKTLPRGGTSIFPKHLVVALYGNGSGPALGVLGEGTPAEAAARMVRFAAPYGPASGRPVLPAFELITTVAQRSPGPDGLYSAPMPDAMVQTYLDAVRKAKGLLVLDLQPGRGDFLAQAKRYEKFLVQPDVGLGLDPEWQLTAGQLPGRQIGRTSAAKLNQVSAYLAGLVKTHRLPQKLFVVHQFKISMIPDRAKAVARPGLATVIHIDGFGPQGSKREVYGVLSTKDREFANGFKLFIDEDTDLMTPREAMALRPQPDLITYQ